MALANPTVSTTFTIDYEAEVHQAFQQRGSLFMNAVRLKRGVIGSQVKFPIYGAVEANQKSTHGDIVPLNPDHSVATATLEDWYAGIYSDKLDELKANIDERREAAKTGAKALGRRADSVVKEALQNATQIEAVATSGLTLAKIRSAIETLDGNSVDPDDRWGFVGAHQWQELMAISEFANADYVGVQHLPFATGARTRFWNGINWVFHPNLPLQDAGANRDCYLFHRGAVGLGIGQDITVVTGWVHQKASYLINHMMSMGAVIIDQNGIVEIICDDDATIT